MTATLTATATLQIIYTADRYRVITEIYAGEAEALTDLIGFAQDEGLRLTSTIEDGEIQWVMLDSAGETGAIASIF
ncbi:hypothetical protein ABH922_002970 [Rhodococcus sp. 27YEA15]|uniref:hypothetical protein n=1 Tax=Rhodococcus sp. 27YEA15 TaxID=3156259 RepID=UPI003C7DFBB9